MKKILKWVLVLLMAVLFTAGIIIGMNFTFLERALTYPAETDITNSSWFTPKAIIKGSGTSDFLLADDDSLTIPSTALDNISKYANERNTSALLVLHKGKLQLENYWRGHSEDLTTHSASIAKTIVNIAIGIAIEDGFIKSEKEPAATYISEWSNDDRNAILIEDLMLMQSGLQFDGPIDDPFSYFLQMYFGPDASSVALSVPSVNPPAEYNEYNNVNTQILGIILERATEESIESYVSRKIWMPLGARDAGWWLDSEDGMPKAFGHIFARTEDYALLGQLILQKGEWNNQQIIPPSWFDKMITPSAFREDYGYHVQMYDDDVSGSVVTTYLLEGYKKQLIYIIPHYELVVVRVGEDPGDWDRTYIVNELVASLEND